MACRSGPRGIARSSPRPLLPRLESNSLTMVPRPDDFAEAPPTETVEMGSPRCLVVGLDCRSMNLYRFLRVRFPRLPRSRFHRWIADGQVRVNGAAVIDSRPLRAGDVVEVDAEVESTPRRAPRPWKILYEDESMLAVEKSAGVAAAPERSRKPDLLTLLREARPSATEVPKLVHRLDKHASGVVVYALGRAAKQALVKDFAERRVTKDYLALVSGHLQEALSLQRSQVAASSGRRVRMRVVPHGGKDAVTLVRRAFEFTGFTVVHARPITGRTHQIRLHLHALGNSIVGDDVYHGVRQLFLSQIKAGYRRSRGEVERPLLDRLALHATRLRLRSPATGNDVVIESPLPRDIQTTLRQLQKTAGLRPAEEFRQWSKLPLGEDDPFAEVTTPDLTPDLELEEPQS